MPLFYHQNYCTSNNHFPWPYKTNTNSPKSTHQKLTKSTTQTSLKNCNFTSASTRHRKQARRWRKKMASVVPVLLFLFSLTVLSISGAQERAPHGLANEDPVSLSPSAYDFFHPTTKNPNTKNPCGGASCSPLPLAAQVQANEAYASKVSTPQNGRSRVGAGAIAGIVFGFAFVVLSAMGVYYVAVNRRSNSSSKSDQPDVWFS